MRKILVTGGTGYIGSHTCVELIQAGYEVVIIDNLCNSSESVIHSIQSITGKLIQLIKLDLRDKPSLETVIQQISPDLTIHFAGLKAVGESVSDPLSYYSNNVVGTLHLLEALDKTNCRRLIFSSSATVYGSPQHLPIDESHPLSSTNPYGQTKLVIEQMLREFSEAQPAWSISILRYFNPVGAHASGLIGENPQGTPNNLMPYIAGVAAGSLARLNVWGDNYDTLDGTGVRDYIHVVDLAVGHLKAMNFIENNTGISTFNLGTGKGYSVLEVIHAFEAENNVKIPYHICPRREGDVAECYASPTKANKELQWVAERDLAQMCRDHWHYQFKQRL